MIRRSARLPCVVLVFAGCAPKAAVTVRVDPALFARLPELDRMSVNSKEEPEVARAGAENKKADEELAEARRQASGSAEERKATLAATRQAEAKLDEASRAKEAHAVEQARIDLEVARQGEQVQAAKAAWQAAVVAWRERLVEAARWRVVAAQAKLELARAEQVNQGHLGTVVDLMPYRTQNGRLHQGWIDARARAAQAHAEVDRLARELSDRKTRYAEARKVVLPPPKVEPPAPPAK